MTRTAGRLGAALAAGAWTLSACGGALPEQSGPAGVDGLVIPTPSADPADFVATIDNPWLPLEPGTTWRYRSRTGDTTLTVTVADETRDVQRVATTVVEGVATDAGGDVVAESSAWFAQDTEGNVWTFGEQRTTYDDRGRRDTAVSWQAGVDGAQAGIVMLARPRVGDGYREEYAEGTAEDRATVLSLDATVQTPLADYSGVLEIEERSTLAPAVVEREYYARGVGLVVEEPASGGTGGLELVAHDPA